MYKDNEVLCQFFYQPIQIVKLEELLCDKRGRLAYPLIIVVYEGHAIYTLQGRQLQLSSNSIMFVDDVDDFQLLKANECTGVVIIYRAYGPNIINLLQDTTLMEHCSYRLMNLVKEIEREAKITVESNPFRLQKLFSEMLEELYNHLCIHKQQEGLWIDRVLDYMNLNFNEDLTREQMAEKAQVSPEHFSRTFHRYTGYTYSEYLTLLRIRESQKKLLLGMPKLDDLAQVVGYREGTYLSRKFKEIVGVSPTVYYQKSKRLIVLNANHTACLLALGITPVLGVYSPFLEDIKSVPSSQKLKGYEYDITSNYQEIAVARPDVIINYSSGKEKQTLLSLAPVFELPCRQLSWREQFELIANLVDRREVYNNWLQQYDAQVAQCNQLLDQQLGARGTAIVWEIGSQAAYCINSSHGRGSHILYEDLGFSRPDEIVTHNIEKTGYLTVNIEEIVHFPADYIFVTALPTKDFGKEWLLTALHSEKWQSLVAVQKKQVYFINQYELFYGYDPLSTTAQLQKLMEVLTS
ncbi:AraC family transcriptional regulator [Lysinibacillus sphaericus]|uniref:ABC-type Fe3+-hydroxamate transport system, periplasmic component n=5 Tax=Bacillaceae TaxID=186817 RepID=B1HY66_LYSSC|nr:MULTISPECIES: ABC transporter substrate-binding protein [Lysinibacillus]MBE5086347.1 AraC family transcriptional regulator [Bacillus thuringiensis]ACA38327.1 ABC-type Fe3+-hydroxamate transport system, periplasmic component [Lysinibacillus sphaericus C3-41]AMO31371.1 Fe3+-hydroxamate ABC transporter substrate-binding protein [Lysinibacillus sphaericus]AMR89517.1 Fe3+-hydroxamate ABC transporter substrate-binding protein [Lysinibacillus sphaericus]ANA47588.1 Fe3+-hydroxamate ABC transporter 